MAGIFIPTVTESSVNAPEQIKRIIDAERIPITRMEEEVASLQGEKEHWIDLRRSIIQLSDAAKALYQFGNAFSTRALNSSNPGVVEGSARPSTDLGNYDITVSQLASVDKFASAPLPDDTEVEAGSYVFHLGTSTRKVEFSGGSIQEFVEAINVQARDIVQATVIGVTENEYVAIFSGTRSGTDQGLTFSGMAASLAQEWNVLTEQSTPVQALSHAQDAHISIEGITVSRSSNSIENLIPGITLTLHNTSEAPVSLSVVPDKEFSKNQIINFVGSYNALMQQVNILGSQNERVIDEINFFTPEDQERAQRQLGALQGDNQLNRLRFSLQSLMGGAITVEGRTRVLEEIGISTNQSGQASFSDVSKRRGYLEINEAKLDAALENHLNDTAKFFGGDNDKDLIIDSGVAFQIEDITRPYLQNSGIIANRMQTIDASVVDTETQINRYSDRLEDMEDELRREFAILEQQIRAMEANSRALNNFIPNNN